MDRHEYLWHVQFSIFWFVAEVFGPLIGLAFPELVSQETVLEPTHPESVPFLEMSVSVSRLGCLNLAQYFCTSAEWSSWSRHLIWSFGLSPAPGSMTKTIKKGIFRGLTYYPFKKYVEYFFFSWMSEHDVTFCSQTLIGCPDHCKFCFCWRLFETV